MRCMKLLVATGVTCALALALLAASASSALATGPGFSVEAFALSTNEVVEAEAVGAQVLSAGGVEVECPTVSLESGEIFPTAPGTSEETIVYGGCHEKGNTGCEARTNAGTVAGQIETKALSSKLYYRTKGGAEGNLERTKTVTLIKPTTGKVLAELELKGTGCPVITSTRVEGEVAVENEEGERVEQTLTAPAAVIKTVWEEGVPGVEVKVKELKAFGFAAASYVGKDKVKLAGLNAGKNWGIRSGAGGGGGGDITVLPPKLNYNKMNGDEAKPITIRNTTASQVKIESFSLGGAEPAGFMVNDLNTCKGKTIGPGLLEKTSCVVKVKLIDATKKAAELTVQLKIEPAGPVLKPVVVLSD